MAHVLQRIRGASTGGTPTGLHGTNIDSVAALPNGRRRLEVLDAGPAEHGDRTSSSLVFQVTVHNGGDSQEVQIPVTLTIDRPASQGGPITKTEKIQLIDPGDRAVRDLHRPRLRCRSPRRRR